MMDPEVCFDILDDLSGELGEDYYHFMSINELVYELREDMIKCYGFHKMMHERYYRREMNFLVYIGYFGDLGFIKWLHHSKRKPVSDHIITGVCRRGNTEVVEWLINEKIKNVRNTKKAMIEASRYGHFEVIKLMHELIVRGMKKGKKYWFDIYEGAINEACTGGHLEIAKWLSKRGNKQICVDNLSNLEILKWVYYENPRCIAHLNLDYVLGIACLKNNLDVAKWAYDNMDIESFSYWGVAILNVCGGKNLEFVKWLHLIPTPKCKNELNVHALSWARYSGSPEVIIWLIEYHRKYRDGRIIDYTCCIEAIDYACASGDTELICALRNHRSMKITDHSIWCARDNGHFEVVEWLEKN